MLSNIKININIKKAAVKSEEKLEGKGGHPSRSPHFSTSVVRTRLRQ